MTGGGECIAENDTLLDAAKRLAELDVGAMPICGEDNRLKGMDKALAQGKHPGSTRAGEFAVASRSPSAPTTQSKKRCTPWPSTRFAACRSSMGTS
jgi:hypothetical protein